MEMQRAQRALAPRGAAPRLHVRGNFPRPHDRQGPQPRHRLVRDSRHRMARAQSRLRALARPGEFRSRRAADQELARVKWGRLTPRGWRRPGCRALVLRDRCPYDSVRSALILRSTREACASRRTRAATVAAPGFETRGFAALLTMRRGES